MRVRSPQRSRNGLLAVTLPKTEKERANVRRIAIDNTEWSDRCKRAGHKRTRRPNDADQVPCLTEHFMPHAKFQPIARDELRQRRGRLTKPQSQALRL